MALQTLTTYSTTPIFIGAGNGLYVSRNGELVTTVAAISGTVGSSHEVAVMGTVTSFDTYALHLLDTFDAEVVIGPDATLTSFGTTAVNVSATYDIKFSNAGTIIGGDGDAVHYTYTGDNSPTLDLINTGTIQGARDGVDAYISGGRFNIVNGGEIISGSGVGIDISDNGTGSATIANTGSISSIRSLAATEITNTGSIIGLTYLSVYSDVVVNSGTMGDIELRTGDDTFDGRGGVVNGVVDGGSGDDTFIIDDAGILLAEGLNGGTDEVQSLVNWALGDNFENLTLLGADNIDGTGNELANTIAGNAGNNRLDGLAGDDSISGNGGNDVLVGDGGNDTLLGNDGNDRLVGGIGVDVLRGNDGDDTLVGNSGNDNLAGGNGDDVLIGAAGADVLTGDEGADVFLYRAVTDSTVTFTDRITDFTIGEDRIDLSGVLGTTIDMQILGSFTGTGPSARTLENALGNTVVQVDVDGDSVADMQIVVSAVTGMTEADFIM